MAPVHSIIPRPLQHSGFSLDVSGVVGFLGGDESLSAMTTVHLMRGRRWAGFYNSPGSLQVARKYGKIPESGFWNWLFPGPTDGPAKTLELDNMQGPRYIGVYSGTQLPFTGHLAHLLSNHCQERVQKSELPQPRTLADLEKEESEEEEELQSKPDSDEKAEHGIYISIVNLEAKAKSQSRENLTDIPPEYLVPFGYWGIIPILSTFSGAVLCALVADWFSCGIILFGALSNGVSTFVLGSATLQLIGPKPSDKSPKGDGILWDASNIIILKGTEQLVSRITRGHYNLSYKDSAPAYHKIGIGSLLLLTQFLVQLFLVPQGILIGQIIFLWTLAMSWGFNAYMASFNHKKLQADVLLKVLGNPKIYKFRVDKWSTAAALVTMYTVPKDPMAILQELVPNATPAWDAWRRCVTESIKQNKSPSQVRESLLQRGDIVVEEADQAFVEDFVHRADKARTNAWSLRAGISWTSFPFARDSGSLKRIDETKLPLLPLEPEEDSE